MKTRLKPLPVAMTFASALYLIYVASGEDTTLNADAVGGDPGGKLLPLAIAVFLLLGFFYLAIKERSDGKKTDKGTVFLFLWTLGVAVAYVALTKYIGFVMLTFAMVYILEYMYSTIDEKRRLIPSLVAGVVGEVLTVLGYTAIRMISRLLSVLGSRNAIPPFISSSPAIATISLVAASGFVVLLALTLNKKMKQKGYGRESFAALISFSAVLLLYVIFKMYFRVSLAPGLLRF